MLARLSLIAVLLAVQAAVLPSSAAAHPGKRLGLTFQDVRPVKLTGADAGSAGLEARFCNLNRRPATEVEVRVTGVRADEGSDAIRDDAWKLTWKRDEDQAARDLPEGEKLVLDAGECIDLTATTTGSVKATSTGILVATSAGAGVARRRVILTVDDTAADGSGASTVHVNPWRILPKTVSDFGVAGVNFAPSLLNPFDTAALNAGVLVVAIVFPFLLFGPRARRIMLALLGSAIVLGLILGWGEDALDPHDAYFEGSGPSEVHLASPPVDAKVRSGAVGSLIGTDGLVAMAAIVGDDDAEVKELQIEGIPRAGAYTGKIDLLPGDKDSGEATVTANVRDWWPYALLTIAVGVLLGAWITWYFSVERPRRLVGQRAARLREEVDAACLRLCASQPDLYAKYTVRRRLQRRLADIKELMASDDAEERKQAATDLTSAESYFHDARRLWMQLPRLERAAQRVAGLVEEMNLEIDGQDVPSVFRAWELLSSRLDCGGADADGSELKARRTEVDDALALLHEQALSLPRADQIRVAAEAIKAPDGWDETAKSSLSSDKDALREAVGELIAAPALDDAREAYASVVAAGTAILELAKNTEPQALRIAVAEAITLGFSAELAQVTAAAEEPQPPEGLGGLVAPAPPPSSEALRRRFKLTERQMATLSGLLAVLSGLLALYVSSDTWGAPGDYLKAILWGSVVSEGVKYVAALVARTGPAT